MGAIVGGCSCRLVQLLVDAIELGEVKVWSSLFSMGAIVRGCNCGEYVGAIDLGANLVWCNFSWVQLLGYKCMLLGAIDGPLFPTLNQTPYISITSILVSMEKLNILPFWQEIL